MFKNRKNLILAITSIILIILSLLGLVHIIKKSGFKFPKFAKPKLTLEDDIQEKIEIKKEDKLKMDSSNNHMKFDFKKNEKLIGIVVVVFLLILVAIQVGLKMKGNSNSNKEIVSIAAASLDKMDEVKTKDIPKDEIVLTIGDESITYEKYKYYLETTKTEMDDGDDTYWFGKNEVEVTDNDANVISTVDTSTSADKLELNVIEKLRKIVAINQLAKEYKLTVTDKELEENLQSIIDNVGGEENFNKVLEDNDISKDLYKDILKSTMQEEKLLKTLFGDKIKDSISEDDIARIKHILVTYNDEIVASSDITEDVENIIAENEKVGTATDTINIFKKKDNTAKPISTLEKDETFTIKEVSEDNNWLTISYNGNNAYVENKNVTIEEKPIDPNVTDQIKEEDNVVKQLTKQEAFDLTTDILTKLDNGEDFDALMKQYTEDASMIDNEAGYYIVRPKDDKDSSAIEKSAFKLKVGTYSKIIETTLGFHIIYRCPIEDNYIDDHILDFASDSIWNEYDALIEDKAKDIECSYGENYISAFTNSFIKPYKNYLNINKVETVNEEKNN